jgi:hypothetical protein
MDEVILLLKQSISVASDLLQLSSVGDLHRTTITNKVLILLKHLADASTRSATLHQKYSIQDKNVITCLRQMKHIIHDQKNQLAKRTDTTSRTDNVCALNAETNTDDLFDDCARCSELNKLKECAESQLCKSQECIEQLTFDLRKARYLLSAQQVPILSLKMQPN